MDISVGLGGLERHGIITIPNATGLCYHMDLREFG